MMDESVVSEQKEIALSPCRSSFETDFAFLDDFSMLMVETSLSPRWETGSIPGGTAIPGQPVAKA